MKMIQTDKLLNSARCLWFRRGLLALLIFNLLSLSSTVLAESQTTHHINNLKDRSKKVRTSAATALGKLRDPRAVEPLVEAFAAVALEVFRKLNIQREAQLLRYSVASIDGEDEELQERIVWALGEIGTPAAAQALIAIIRVNPHVPWWVSSGLGKIKDAGTVELVIAEIRSEPGEKLTLWFDVLTEIGSAATKALCGLLRDENQALRRHAFRSLLGARTRGSRTSESAVSVIEYLRTVDAERLEPGELLGAFLFIGDERYLEFLPELFKATDGEFPENLQRTFSNEQLFVTTVTSGLLNALDHKDPRVRRGATLALRARVRLLSDDSMIEESDVIAIVSIEEDNRDHWSAKIERSIKGAPESLVSILKQRALRSSESFVRGGRYLAFLKSSSPVYQLYGEGAWKRSSLRITQHEVDWPKQGKRYEVKRSNLDAVIAEISERVAHLSSPPAVPRRMVELWRSTLDGRYNFSRAKVNDLVVVSVQKGSEAIHLEAFRISDGRLAWRSPQGGSIGPVHRGNVIVSRPKEVFALDGQTGRELWRFVSSTPGRVFRFPAVLDGDRLYLVESLVPNDKLPTVSKAFSPNDLTAPLYCLDAATGRQLWSIDIETGPIAVESKNIYVAHQSTLSCFSKLNHERCWSQPAPIHPAASGSLLTEIIVLPSVGLLGRSVADGEPRWENRGYQVDAAAELKDGILYTPFPLSEARNTFAAVDARTGEIIWLSAFLGQIPGGATVDNESVCFTSWDNNLYCLDRRNGKLRAQYSLALDRSAPAPVLTDRCAILSFNDRILCLGSELP